VKIVLYEKNVSYFASIACIIKMRGLKSLFFIHHNLLPIGGRSSNISVAREVQGVQVPPQQGKNTKQFCPVCGLNILLVYSNK